MCLLYQEQNQSLKINVLYKIGSNGWGRVNGSDMQKELTLPFYINVSTGVCNEKSIIT